MPNNQLNRTSNKLGSLSLNNNSNSDLFQIFICIKMTKNTIEFMILNFL